MAPVCDTGFINRQGGIRSEEDSDETPDGVVRPQQYLADNEYFATVKRFLERKFNLLPVTALEYLEHDSIIFVSFYIQEDELANYLLIMSSDGQVLLQEKLDEHLKGIGLDTFFVFSGCVFFVKNKAELVSYQNCMINELIVAGISFLQPQVLVDSIGKETINGKVFVIHKVGEKETLYGISKRYGTTVESILQYNPTASAGLEIGQILKVPYVPKQTPARLPVQSIK